MSWRENKGECPEKAWRCWSILDFCCLRCPVFSFCVHIERNCSYEWLQNTVDGGYSSEKSFLCQTLAVCSNNQIKVIAWGIIDSVSWIVQGDLLCFLYAIQIILYSIDYINVFTFHVQRDSLKMFMTLTTRKEGVDSVTNA